MDLHSVSSFWNQWYCQICQFFLKGQDARGKKPSLVFVFTHPITNAMKTNMIDASIYNLYITITYIWVIYIYIWVIYHVYGLYEGNPSFCCLNFPNLHSSVCCFYETSSSRCCFFYHPHYIPIYIPLYLQYYHDTHLYTHHSYRATMAPLHFRPNRLPSRLTSAEPPSPKPKRRVSFGRPRKTARGWKKSVGLVAMFGE